MKKDVISVFRLLPAEPPGRAVGCADAVDVRPELEAVTRAEASERSRIHPAQFSRVWQATWLEVGVGVPGSLVAPGRALVSAPAADNANCSLSRVKPELWGKGMVRLASRLGKFVNGLVPGQPSVQESKPTQTSLLGRPSARDRAGGRAEGRHAVAGDRGFGPSWVRCC